MFAKAYGKVNLCLDVVEKRPDGYHELDSIMAPIDLYDDISFTLSDTMSFTCTPDIRIRAENNSITKAVAAMRAKYGFTDQFAIHLTKRIPSQAGLGGGSSDAAAVINWLDQHYNYGMSDQEKIDLGVKIGADVPFCLFRKPARVQGIGEKLEFFDVSLPMWIVLVQPHRGVSTKQAFASLQFDTILHPDPISVKTALSGNNYPLFLISLGNSLEANAVRMVPDIDQLKHRLLRLGCDKALMTGSGSVVMGFTQHEEIADRAVRNLKHQYRFAIKTKIVTK
jgi:4-diphosphocytidyl-2-C-methyl-D-erythritol kinase